ncbi:hypothetical protein ACWFRB_00145 [Rhodococcus sp. NPDC055112]
MLRRLATAVVARPRLVLTAALLFLVAAEVFGAGVTSHLKVGGFRYRRATVHPTPVKWAAIS